MPTRLLREGILSSERVDQLDWQSEVFYRRLMSKVDDHGLYDARLSMLRSSLYPLRVDRVREADIARWMATCQKAGLIVLYEADGKPFLKMVDTNWKTRSDPKYPLPPDNSCKQEQTTVNTSTVVVGVVGVVDEGKTLSGKPDLKPQAVEILNFLNAKAEKNFLPVPANIEMIVARLREGYPFDDIRSVIARKCGEWKADEKMAEYLRPKTLFSRTNFANYHGQLAQVSHEK
jgi:uncharacterized phage protein (TIGR02220 family)